MSRYHLHKAVSALLALAFFSACTKKLPFQTQYKKPEVSSKSLIDDMDSSKGKAGATYIYVPSSDSSNRNSLEVSGAMPYWQGQTKRVKFQFTETALKVLEVDTEDRFAGNPTNMTLVMTIPVDHVEYRCAQDRKGDCQNKEEKNEDISWEQKSQFVPNFDGMKTVEANLLPVEMDQVFGQSCYKEASSRFLNYKLTEDAMNVQIEKIFQAEVSCLEKLGVSIRSLADLTTTIVYHYSFVKAERLDSSDYTPVSYRSEDEDTFGFFNTDKKALDVDANQTFKGETQLMNRWNPNRKVVTYYLSKEFNKPENKNLIAPTQKAFAAINNGLAKAGVDLKFDIQPSEDKSPGDIRNSMIVLVEDPIAAGPLGYGPSVADPKTGEIVSGRVVMYLGNLLQSVKYTYDDIVKQQKYEQKLAAQQNGSPAAAKAIVASPALAHTKLAALGKKQANLSALAKVDFKPSPGIGSVVAGHDIRSLSKSEIRNLMNTKAKNTISSGTDYLSAMSKYCNYPSELFNFNDAIKKAMHNQISDLKPWEKLTDSEKKAVIDIVVPEVWVPILVHELGHNLGFRHNFKGSEDKDNFYSTQELANMGVNYPINYSTVMDYALSDLNALPTLGKYDIAALKFGYKREIETKDGQVLKIKTDLQDLKAELSNSPQKVELKDYGYCTDEHVEVNPGCKRFDEGTSVTEIVQNLIATYHEFYSRRNFRALRSDFSLAGNTRYANRIKSSFQYIRAPKERYEDIKARFELPDDAEEWKTIPFLKDLKDAALLSAHFFMDVIETPNVTCAIAKQDKKEQIVAILDIDQIDNEAMSCFDLKLKSDFVVAGQTGKFFNSRKDRSLNESFSKYADQIDIRGIWIDKVLAAEMLFSRKLNNSSYDDVLGNYLDIPDIRSEVLNMTENMVMNTVTKDLAFVTGNGDKFTLPGIELDMFGVPGVDSTNKLSHFIPAALTDSSGDLVDTVSRSLGISSSAQSYQKVLLQKLTKELLIDPHTAQSAKPIAEMVSVYKTAPVFQIDEGNSALIVDINSDRYLALPSNLIAYNVIGQIQLNKLLAAITEEQFKKLIEDKNAETAEKPAVAPADASNELKKLYDMSLEQLSEAASGRLPSVDRLSYILSILPTK